MHTSMKVCAATITQQRALSVIKGGHSASNTSSTTLQQENTKLNQKLSYLACDKKKKMTKALDIITKTKLK